MNKINSNTLRILAYSYLYSNENKQEEYELLQFPTNKIIISCKI